MILYCSIACFSWTCPHIIESFPCNEYSPRNVLKSDRGYALPNCWWRSYAAKTFPKLLPVKRSHLIFPQRWEVLWSLVLYATHWICSAVTLHFSINSFLSVQFICNMSSINFGQLISNVDAVGSSSIIHLRGHMGKLVKRKSISPADTSLLIAVKSDLLEGNNDETVFTCWFKCFLGRAIQELGKSVLDKPFLFA